MGSSRKPINHFGGSPVFNQSHLSTRIGLSQQKGLSSNWALPAHQFPLNIPSIHVRTLKQTYALAAKANQLEQIC